MEHLNTVIQYINDPDKYLLSIKASSEVLNKLKYKYFCASSLSTYNFSTLYTILLHKLIKDKLLDLIEIKFISELSFLNIYL